MAKYDHTAPKDILQKIKQKKKQGYFVQRLNDKKFYAQYNEVILKNKKKAKEIYDEIRKDLHKKLPKVPKGSSKEHVRFLRDQQIEKTGSFVEQPNNYALEIERAKHILRHLEKQGLKPRYPLRFLDKVDTGKRLKEYFKNLLYDFSKNNIDELNLAITGLPTIKGCGFHDFSRDWDHAYFDCLEMWQDPKTGYWGPWFKKGNKIIKRPDLSTTFHILRIYYDKKTLKLNNPKRDMKHKKSLIKTTWDIRLKDYPYGWLEKRNWSTHHNYDVAEIFLYLFDEMDQKEKDDVRKLFRRFLRWCLNKNLQKDGGFIGHYYPRIKEPTIYLTHLAVLLLRAIGYFSNTYRERLWNKKMPINSYRIYKNRKTEDEFDTKNLKSIIYNKNSTLDPLDTRSRIFQYWKKHKQENISEAMNTNTILKFEEFPPDNFQMLNKVPKLEKDDILVAVDCFGGKVWTRTKDLR